MVRTVTYGYDKVGNRTLMTESNGTQMRTTTYQYDANDRLTREVSDGPPLAYRGPGDDGTRYAAAPRRPSKYAGHALGALAVLTFAVLLSPVRLIRPRAAGTGRRQRRRRVLNATVALVMAVVLGAGPESVLALHQEALLYRALAAAAVAQAGPVETLYAYDANGNLISRTRGGLADTYVYDAENRLVTADLHIDRTSFASYTYDPDGIRQSVTVDGQTTWHLTDKNQPYAQVLEERDGGDRMLAVRYTYGDDLISQTRPGDPAAVTRYYHYDGQLSTRQLTDAADPAAVAVTDTYTFDAFGNLLASAGSTPNRYLYTGEQYDPNVGFYYLRARYYDQAVGRFIGKDAFPGSPWDPVSIHNYLYAHANPVSNTDPSGHFAYSQILTASFLRGKLIGLIVPLTMNKALIRAVSGFAAGLAFEWYSNQYIPPLITELGLLSHDLALISPLAAAAVDRLAMEVADFAVALATKNVLRPAVAPFLLPYYAWISYDVARFFSFISRVNRDATQFTETIAAMTGIPYYVEVRIQLWKAIPNLLMFRADPAGEVAMVRRSLRLALRGQFVLAAQELGRLQRALTRYGTATLIAIR